MTINSLPQTPQEIMHYKQLMIARYEAERKQNSSLLERRRSMIGISPKVHLDEHGLVKQLLISRKWAGEEEVTKGYQERRETAKKGGKEKETCMHSNRNWWAPITTTGAIVSIDGNNF